MTGLWKLLICATAVGAAFAVLAASVAYVKLDDQATQIEATASTAKTTADELQVQTDRFGLEQIRNCIRANVNAAILRFAAANPLARDVDPREVRRRARTRRPLYPVLDCKAVAPVRSRGPAQRPRGPEVHRHRRGRPVPDPAERQGHRLPSLPPGRREVDRAGREALAVAPA